MRSPARGELVEWPGHEETLAAVDAALALAADDGAPSAERVETLGGGWVSEEALAIGLYCALVADDVHSGLVLAVNHGGDSDSTGSIAGNLLGALHGEDAVPQHLVGRLDARDVIRTVADDLVRVFGDRDPPDPERYPA